MTENVFVLQLQAQQTDLQTRLAKLEAFILDNPGYQALGAPEQEMLRNRASLLAANLGRLDAQLAAHAEAA